MTNARPFISNELMYGMPWMLDKRAPKGKVFLVGGNIVTAVDFRRPPLWTRHMLGVIEAERDRRRLRKGRK